MHTPVHVNEFASARARREQMIKNEVKAKRAVDPAHRSNPRCASFLLLKDKGERGETQEVITRESTKEGGKQGQRG